MLESNYCLRFLSYVIQAGFKQSVFDYKLFPKVKIESSQQVFNFDNNRREIDFNKLPLLLNQNKEYNSFKEFLDKTETLALLVIKDDQIIYEHYKNGFDRTSQFQMFSISKSYTSTMVGIALDEKFIDSIDDPITKYLPELNNQLEQITINNLLQMHSGIKFTEGYYPWKDMVKSYLHPNGRLLAKKMSVNDEVGKYFHYNDYHLILLSMLLKNVLPISPAKYFQEKIWKKIGAEFPAQLCLDNSNNGLKKFESGIVCSPIDLAKFGRLMLNKGNWNGEQIISAKWISDSTDFFETNSNQNYYDYYKNKSWNNWFRTGNAGYKNYWWGYKIDESYFEYFAMGILGQILYISPKQNAISIRIGNKWGIKGWWPTVLKDLIHSL